MTHLRAGDGNRDDPAMTSAQDAALRAYASGPTAELEQCRSVLRAWLVDIAKRPAPHRGPALVGIVMRGLDAIEFELHRRETRLPWLSRRGTSSIRPVLRSVR